MSKVIILSNDIEVNDSEWKHIDVRPKLRSHIEFRDHEGVLRHGRVVNVGTKNTTKRNFAYILLDEGTEVEVNFANIKELVSN